MRNDLSSPVFCKNSLIVVDAFSKWLEVASMDCLISSSQITVRSSHHKYFRKYLNEGGIKQIASAPFHLSSSSQAERMVPTTKVSLSTVAQREWEYNLANFLFCLNTLTKILRRELLKNSGRCESGRPIVLPSALSNHKRIQLEKKKEWLKPHLMKTQQLSQHLEKKVKQHHNLQILQVWDIVDRLLYRENKIVNDEAESRIVYHYQFLAWPDHGVPPNPGTFIAIDLILCLIRKYGLQCTIDIRRTVQMLRSQRSGMVQTEAQYKFVYMSVHYYIDTFAKLLHEHKRIEDSGHEYTNIRYSAEVASNQVIPISPSPFGSSIRPCNHPQCEACSLTPVVYPPQLIPPPRPKKGPRNPRPENS
ncbi:hypothetical protein TPS_09360 [Trichinella pseudospiralis]